jgi:hypothetical protein
LSVLPAEVGSPLEGIFVVFSHLCPTRNRPVLLVRYLASLYKNSQDMHNSEVLLYVDADDPRLVDYRAVVVNYAFEHTIKCISGPRAPLGKLWNILAAASTGDALIMGNDDLVFITRNWDTLLEREIQRYTDSYYCFFLRDINRGDRDATTFPVMSRKWYQALGYFVPECYGFGYHDTDIADISRRVGRCKVVQHIAVDHRHFGGHGKSDQTQESEMSVQHIAHDGTIYDSAEQVARRERDALNILHQIRKGQ